jgi:hypothetical protein
MNSSIPFNHGQRRTFLNVNPYVLSHSRTFLGLVFLALAFVLALASNHGQARGTESASVTRQHQLTEAR